jgi:hypothetical protein
VVATQSLSIDASTLLPAWPSQSGLLATAAVALWSVGLVLYLLLIALIWQRWLTVVMTPATLSPSYWILMGATGITVLAGSDILTLPASLPAISAIAGFVKGTCFVFWSFGTWWIPLLIVGLWRRPAPVAAPPIHPLDRSLRSSMYSVAHVVRQGRRAQLHGALSHGVLWVAIAAWLLVAAAGLANSPAGQPSPPASDLTSAT